jgi:hypothetical protein
MSPRFLYTGNAIPRKVNVRVTPIIDPAHCVYPCRDFLSPWRYWYDVAAGPGGHGSLPVKSRERNYPLWQFMRSVVTLFMIHCGCAWRKTFCFSLSEVKGRGKELPMTALGRPEDVSKRTPIAGAAGMS